MGRTGSWAGLRQYGLTPLLQPTLLLRGEYNGREGGREGKKLIWGWSLPASRDCHPPAYREPCWGVSPPGMWPGGLGAPCHGSERGPVPPLNPPEMLEGLVVGTSGSSWEWW